MPKYDFRCDACDETEEYTLSIKDKHEVYCLFCDELMRKVFAPTPAVFKGQGWAKMSAYLPKENL